MANPAQSKDNQFIIYIFSRCLCWGDYLHNKLLPKYYKVTCISHVQMQPVVTTYILVRPITDLSEKCWSTILKNVKKVTEHFQEVLNKHWRNTDQSSSRPRRSSRWIEGRRSCRRAGPCGCQPPCAVRSTSLAAGHIAAQSQAHCGCPSNIEQTTAVSTILGWEDIWLTLV